MTAESVPPVPVPGFAARAWAAVDALLDEPRAPRALAGFRIALAAFALLQALLWYPDWLAFFGRDGWMQWELSQALDVGWTLHMAHVHALFKHFGLNEDQSVMVFYWLYLACGLGLLLGWHTRVFGALTCLCHFVMMGTMPVFSYGLDIFLQMSLFYLTVLPVARAWSLDLRQGRVKPEPTWGSGLGLRVLQAHLCLIYISAGWEKALSPEWWSGNALWRSLVQPDFRQLDVTWLAHYPWLVAGLAWFTIVLESAYFAAMWVPRLRAFWLAAIVSLHLGIGLFLGLWMFGLIMILMSVSAFGYAAWGDVQAFRAARAARRAEPPAA